MEIKKHFHSVPGDAKYTEFWNVSGELLAAMHVMEYALTHGISKCSLYYDYMGDRNVGHEEVETK